MTDEELDTVADALWARMEEKNGKYVPVELCKERSGRIEKMLYGLYGLTGLVIVGIVIQFARAALAR